SVEWPANLSINHRLSPALPPMQQTQHGDRTRLELSLDNLQPIVAPQAAPARYAYPRAAEFSNFQSWAEMGALLAPLYVQASNIASNSALSGEIQTIANRSQNQLVRAQAALNLVQDRIRYVALAMGEGGLVPADASTTWSRRFGDCKAKTALLL